MARFFSKQKKYSVFIFFVLFGLFALQWYLCLSYYEPTYERIVNLEKLEEKVESLKEKDKDRIIIPTGMEIFLVQFSDNFTVEISGIIWQVYDEATPEWAKEGVFFPELKWPGRQPKEQEVIFEEKKSNNKTLKSWEFFITQKNPFDYFKYPFDDKVIHLRMWPRSYEKNIFLVPDLSSYKNVTEDSFTGISTSLHINLQEVVDGYFSYTKENNNTDFGLHHLSKKINEPELSFNIEIKRELFSTIVADIIPLFTIWFVLYFLLYLYSLGIVDISRLISSYIGLLFTSVLLHAKLRSQLINIEFIQLEYFYIITYGIIVSLFFLVLEVRENYKYEEEERLLKLQKFSFFYWPILLGTVNLVTFFSLFF